MSDSARDLLVRGIAAAKAGEAAEARRYLERVMNFNPTNQQRLEALFWLSEISHDSEEKRHYLETILLSAPNDARARRKFALLTGELKADEVVDPDRLQKPAGSNVEAGDARRFTCPQCGGRMTYTPDGQSLTCEYCAGKQALQPTVAGRDGVERDFVLALATARGHLHPVNARTFHCKGCGVEYQLPAHQMTLTCPYCLSAHVVENKEEVETFLPDGILPFEIDLFQAKAQIDQWMGENVRGLPEKVDDPVGFYLPVWSFEIGGSVTLRGEVYKNRIWVAFQEVQPVMERNVLIPAVKVLPWNFLQELGGYDLSRIVVFDERYLANYPAEVYQVPLADASLEARRLVYDRQCDGFGGSTSFSRRNLTISTADMVVEAFSLLLFPVWTAYYVVQNKRYALVVNGQSGRINGEKPAAVIRSFFQRLFSSESE